VVDFGVRALKNDQMLMGVDSGDGVLGRQGRKPQSIGKEPRQALGRTQLLNETERSSARGVTPNSLDCGLIMKLWYRSPMRWASEFLGGFADPIFSIRFLEFRKLPSRKLTTYGYIIGDRGFRIATLHSRSYRNRLWTGDSSICSGDLG